MELLPFLPSSSPHLPATFCTEKKIRLDDPFRISETHYACFDSSSLSSVFEKASSSSGEEEEEEAAVGLDQCQQSRHCLK